MLSSWEKQFQERAAEIFKKGPSAQEKVLVEKEREIAMLQQKIGQLVVERDWLKKNLTKSLDHKHRIALVSPDDEVLSVKRQCELAKVNRSSVYCELNREQDNPNHSESLTNLAIMEIIDKAHLKWPSWGYRKMTDYLRNSYNMPFNKKRVRRLMRLMDIIALVSLVSN